MGVLYSHPRPRATQTNVCAIIKVNGNQLQFKKTILPDRHGTNIKPQSKLILKVLSHVVRDIEKKPKYGFLECKYVRDNARRGVHYQK